MPHRTILALASLLLLCAAQPASALTIQVAGQTFPGQVTADVELTYDGVDTLTVEITNTSSVVGSATGFGFNVPDAVTGISALTASGTGDDSDWSSFFPTSSAPGGYIFEAGAGTGPNLNGGTVASGIPMGGTGTIELTFSGNALALAALTVNDFLGEFEDGEAGPADFGVRFQGVVIPGGGSDESDFALHQVPAPGAALLLGVGLLGLRGRLR